MNIMKKVACLTALILISVSLPLRAEENIILDTLGFWRSYFSFSTALVVDGGKFQKIGVECNSPLPPADWNTAEFDDTNWIRMSNAPFASWSHYVKSLQMNAGFVYAQGDSYAISVLCLRGKFNADPVRAGKLNLDLVYRGGVVVYLNGKEVARGHMPKDDKLPVDAPAEPYTTEAYLNDKGTFLGEDNKNVEQLNSRFRTLENIVIPRDVLKKGTNVLAIEIHRSPLPKDVYEKIKSIKDGEKIFDSCGLVTARLTGNSVTPNAVRPSKTQIWNSQPLASDYDTDWGDPNEPLRPIELAGARNGFFSGKVVVGSTSPIKRIKAVVTDLAGKNGGKIPATAIQIRYAVSDLVEGEESLKPIRIDKLEEVPPKEIPVRVLKPSNYIRSIPGSPSPVNGAVLPVWVTVNVPAEAKSDDYEAELSITIDSGAFKVPVKLRVYNYKLPDPKDFTVFAELIQSPETLALVYNVPLWSEKHWKLIEKSLSFIGAMGTKTCYIPLIGKTNMGNAETMVRWVKDKDKYKYDFTVMEKYLDLVEKYQGKPSVVCLYVWDHFLEGEKGGYTKSKSINKEVDESFAASAEKGPEVTLLKNGKAEDFTLPRYNEAEARILWKPLVDELKVLMKKRKLEKAVMMGIVTDRAPDTVTIKFWKDLLPDAPWVKHAHNRTDVSIPLGFTGSVWDLNTILHALVKNGKSGKGWKSKELSTFYPRDMKNSDSVVTFRMMPEITAFGEQKGFARIGADFWSIKNGATVNRFGSQHGLGVMASDGRFSKSSWLNLNIRLSLLASGVDGAIATTRYEMMREGMQECEARIAIEKAIDGNKLRADQSKRCEKMLTERNESIYNGFYDNRAGFLGVKGGIKTYVWSGNAPRYTTCYYLSSGWQERSADLYEAAAEATGTDKKAGFTTSYREQVKQVQQKKQEQKEK